MTAGQRPYLSFYYVSFSRFSFGSCGVFLKITGVKRLFLLRTEASVLDEYSGNISAATVFQTGKTAMTGALRLAVFLSIGEYSLMAGQTVDSS